MGWNIFGKKSPTRTIFGATGTSTEKDITIDINFKEYVDTDAVLNSNLRQLTDSIFQNDIKVDVEDTKDKKIAEDRTKQLKNVNFTRVVKDNFGSLFYNGNMFFEIVANGKKLKEFYWIDGSTLKIKEDDFGKIIEVIQKQPSGDKVLDPKRIINIKAPSTRTGTLGIPLLQPLKYTLNRKRTAENYLAGMIENLSPLLFIEMGEADDKQAQDIKNAIRTRRDPLDPLKLISLLPNEKVGRVDTGTTSNFDAIQKYIDAQNDEINRVVQIPPIVAGTVDNSNRSNSEIQAKFVFGSTTMAWQNWLSNEFTLALKDKLGWDNTECEFPESDERKLEASLVRANKLKELGYSQEAIHKFLVKEGFEIEEDFQEIPEQVGGTKDINDMPSREPRPKDGIPQNEAQRQSDIKNGTKKSN